jgi:hypothetical protein
LASGEPAPVISTFSGSTTGNWSSGTGTSPQVFAVDDRDRAAPVALAGNAPVAQAELHLLVAEFLGGEVGGDGVDGGFVARPSYLPELTSSAALPCRRTTRPRLRLKRFRLQRRRPA